MKIIWSNEAGELDSRTVESGQAAAHILIEMIDEVGELQPGDKITVVEDDEAAV